ncbi:MAG: TetR/AcrR family transcriptional regulator [Alphaproteobacteria bacterium]|nr:TetR/AcrR family transcriptional regulator [Alphaproteobacteria bacterium]
MARTTDPDLVERRRRAILDAATRCFRRHGFHQSTMASICAEANLSAGALYRYFPSKADIIAAIAEEDRQMIAGILEGALTTGDLASDLREAAATLADRVARDPNGQLVAEVLSEASRDRALAARLRAVDEDARGRLSAAIARAQRAGLADPILDPIVAARLLFAGLDGLLIRTTLFGDANPATALGDFQAFVDQLLTPRTAPKPVGAASPEETLP